MTSVPLDPPGAAGERHPDGMVEQVTETDPETGR